MSKVLEERSSSRQRTLKGARIVFNAGRSTIDCRIRNLSAVGAKLEVTSVVGIPNTFDLMPANGSSHACRVVWRSLREIGVSFSVVS
jgi:hypothetical protein